MSLSSFTRNRRAALMGGPAAAALIAAAVSLSPAGAAVAGDVIGHVKDATSGASLAGAVVTTASGKRAVTDRDGGYVLGDLAAGDYEVSVSFLSYKAAKQAIRVPADGSVTLDFAVSGANEVEGVTVTGRQLADVRALNLQMNSDKVSNVISADDLGKFPDNNVADAITRVPGVSVFHNRETGEGEYVTIRGLASDFNVFTINGQRVANTDNGSRQVSLTVLPPFGFQTATVTKTSTPDMDGDAVAGTVDFRTPTAFDSNKPVLRLNAQYGVNEEAANSGQHTPSGAEIFQIDAGRRFGPEGHFGVFLTGYYYKKDSLSEESENDGEWDPTIWRANNTEKINYNSLNLPGLDLDNYRLQQERYGGNFSIDYQNNDNKVYFRSQFARLHKIDDHSELTVKSLNTPRLEQVNPNETDLAQPQNDIVGYSSTLGTIYGYTTSQIVDRNGDGVISSLDMGGCSGASDGSSGSRYSLCGKSGVYSPGGFYVDRNYQTQDEVDLLSTTSLGGESRFGRLKVEYNAFLSYGERGNLAGYSVDYQTPTNIAPYDNTGVTFVNPDPRFPEWELPASAQSLVYDNSALTQFNGAGRRTYQTNERKYGFKFDLTYDAGAWLGLDYVKAGFKYQLQHQDHSEVQYEMAAGAFDYASYGASPFVGQNVGATLHGYYIFGSTYNRAAVIRTIDAATIGHAEDPTVATHYQEGIYAGYGMADWKFDKTEVIAGLRIENTQVNNSAYNTGETCDTNGNCTTDPSHTGMQTTKRSYTEVLPSITATYRPAPKIVYRAAIWTSFSRPAYQYISGASTVTRDGTGAITSISQGNPDLKPMTALNFDLSAEYYLGNAGIISAGAFYKHLKNYIYSNGEAVDGSTLGNVGNNDVTISQPENGHDAHVWGLEADFERRFSELPGFWSGFGVAVNGTYLQSRAVGGAQYRIDANYTTPLLNSPTWLYNADLIYQKYGFEAVIAYNYQGRFIEDNRNNFIDKWNQPYKRMDFHSRYTVGHGVTVGFDVQNVLDDYGYYTSKGSAPGYQKDYIEPGRTLLFSISYSH
ncbi:MAG: TonB-dependent receptor [Caulobacteraceae bacterium]|nr:TonB-dependent receptor [Caulobacteraceae bacterium]